MARFCINTWLANGYQVEFFCYDSSIASVLPDQVIVSDANDIVPKKEVFPEPGKRSGYSGFSNLFRMEVMNHRNATWVDLDAFAITHMAEVPPYIFAREDGKNVNGAIFRAPADSALVTELAAGIRNANKSFWVFGDLGPVALTRKIAELNLDDRILPSKYFYEVGALEIWKIFSPLLYKSMEKRLRSAYFLHMSNELTKGMPFDPFQLRPPAGSYIDRQGLGFWHDQLGTESMAQRQVFFWAILSAWVYLKSRFACLLPSGLVRALVKKRQAKSNP